MEAKKIVPVSVNPDSEHSHKFHGKIVFTWAGRSVNKILSLFIERVWTQVNSSDFCTMQRVNDKEVELWVCAKNIKLVHKVLNEALESLKTPIEKCSEKLVVSKEG
ncbi:MAG: hypothetical protein Q7S19_00435 [bacterium]|nr:hypothetical protein [bacterium]